MGFYFAKKNDGIRLVELRYRYPTGMPSLSYSNTIPL